MFARSTVNASQSNPVAIRAERATDIAAREALLDAAFGADRHERSCQRLRDGRVPAHGLSFSAIRDGRLVGTVRLWHVNAGDVPALMLGPLAVDAAYRDLGIGGALMRRALTDAATRGHGAVLLLGDAPYYERFGFSAEKAADLSLAGPFARERLLGLELRSNALAVAAGMILPTGAALRRARVSRLQRLPVAA